MQKESLSLSITPEKFQFMSIRVFIRELLHSSHVLVPLTSKFTLILLSLSSTLKDTIQTVFLSFHLKSETNLIYVTDLLTSPRSLFLLFNTNFPLSKLLCSYQLIQDLCKTPQKLQICTKESCQSLFQSFIYKWLYFNHLLL